MGIFKKELGKRIKEIRKTKGLTQEQLAEKVGIEPPNISYIENGKYSPTIENFEKICIALDTPPYQFYMFSNPKPIAEIKEELFTALENDDTLLRLLYEQYLRIKLH